MLVDKPDDLDAAVAAGQPLFGLDVGTKTVGIAVSDATRSIASPLTTLRRTRFWADAARLCMLMDERRAGGLVVGLPLNMDGSEGPRCQATRAFVANFLAVRDLPVLLWDERLSTQAVNRFLIEQADASRRRRRHLVDNMAAAYILQGVLDSLRSR